MTVHTPLTRHQSFDLVQSCRDRQGVTVSEAVALAVSSAVLDAGAEELVTMPALATKLNEFQTYAGENRLMTDLPDELVHAWAAAVPLLERHQRRAVLSILCLPLIKAGLQERNLASVLALPTLERVGKYQWRSARPLLPLELVATRMACTVRRGAVPRVAMQGVLESGACTGELAGVRGTCYGSVEAIEVNLPGHAKVQPRTIRLTGWEQRVNADYLGALFDEQTPDATRVFYAGRGVSVAKAQASVCGTLVSVLKLAGFGGDINVKPHSIRNAGLLARVRECADEVEQIVLGMRQLGLTYDGAARVLGLS